MLNISSNKWTGKQEQIMEVWEDQSKIGSEIIGTQMAKDHESGDD